jgi:hypothetical protein
MLFSVFTTVEVRNGKYDVGKHVQGKAVPVTGREGP